MLGGSVDTAMNTKGGMGTSVRQENMAEVRPSCEDVLLRTYVRGLPVVVGGMKGASQCLTRGSVVGPHCAIEQFIECV